MQRYRIILRDYLNQGRDRDVTFTALGAAEEFINSLSREGTVCVYVVTGYNDYGPRALMSVERYVVWNDRDRTAALEAAKADGLTIDDFSAEFIITNLAGTKWVNEGVIMTNKKGQMVPKSTWTPGAVVDYVRRANVARLAKVNESK